jgi:3-methyladenine DNA glycosylase AlkC
MVNNPAQMLGRKGAAKIALIPSEVLLALNAGQIPSVNLNEYLAIDLAKLTINVASQIGLDPQAERLQNTLAMLSAFKPMKRHSHIARALFDLTGEQAQPQRDAISTALANHPSDVARCWAVQWLQFTDQTLADKLLAVRRFAADPHFGVREIAWMAVRDDTAAALDAAIVLLMPWVVDVDENIRRFASELTRPRGVWCAQIEALKAEPWRALPLLEPLKADASRYVQNSVANWLNDASKSQAAWVQGVCDEWVQTSASPHTRYIVKRALRTLDKAG